jgi:enoyl-[acyl-carrier-protein] reductase (NADH)
MARVSKKHKLRHQMQEHCYEVSQVITSWSFVLLKWSSQNTMTAKSITLSLAFIPHCEAAKHFNTPRVVEHIKIKSSSVISYAVSL